MTRPQSIERIREALEIDLRYPKLNPEKLGDDYMRHVMAMTREGLHSKSSIAEQLAWRDQSIKELLTYLEGVERDAKRLSEANEALAREAYDWHSALTLTIAQRGAWKEVAEDQYSKLRTALYGEQGDYPVLGALDAYAAGRHPVLKLPTMRGDE